MNTRLLAVAAIALLTLAACTAGPNPMAADPNLAGFWMGLWHGIIAPITLIVSFFADGVRMYEVHNTGWWYDLGFAIGAGILFGGIWRST